MASIFASKNRFFLQYSVNCWFMFHIVVFRKTQAEIEDKWGYMYIGFRRQILRPWDSSFFLYHTSGKHPATFQGWSVADFFLKFNRVFIFHIGLNLSHISQRSHNDVTNADFSKPTVPIYQILGVKYFSKFKHLSIPPVGIWIWKTFCFRICVIELADYNILCFSFLHIRWCPNFFKSVCVEFQDS